MSDRDHALGTIHLGEEGCERIPAANPVSGLSHQCEPVAIVDLFPRADLLGKDFESDFAQPLPAENRIKLLNPKLIGEPACTFELGKEPLIPLNLLLEPLDQGSQAFNLRALIVDPAVEHAIFGEERFIGRDGRRNRSQGWSFCGHDGRS
jgi:hypothetical protein